MDNDISALVKNLTSAINGKKSSISLEQIANILSTDDGKKVLASLLSDGGEKVKKAAEGARHGDISGVEDIISGISHLPEGEKILREITKGK